MFLEKVLRLKIGAKFLIEKLITEIMIEKPIYIPPIQIKYKKKCVEKEHNKTGMSI